MTIKEKINEYVKNRKLKEKNQILKEKLLTLIDEGYKEKVVMWAYNLVDDKWFLKEHSRRDEIIIEMAKARNIDTAYNVKYLAYDPKIIQNANFLEIVKVVAKGTNRNSLSVVYELNETISFENNENLLILDILLNSSIKYSNFLRLKEAGIFDRKDVKEITELVVQASTYESEDVVTDYLCDEVLDIDFELMEIINNYRSSSRLISLENNLFCDELFDDKEMRFLINETLKYFMDDENEKVELFSCLDLYNEETDPTIERELGKIYGRVLSLPHKEKVKTLQKIRKQL